MLTATMPPEDQSPPTPPRRRPGALGSIGRITRGLLLDSRQRRQIMIYVIVAAVGLTVVGGTVGFDFLRTNIWVFSAYWLLCAFLTLLAVLLAIYDLLMLRLLARRVQRDLETRMEEEAKREEDASADERR